MIVADFQPTHSSLFVDLEARGRRAESEPGGKAGVTEDKFRLAGISARALFGLSGNKMIARAIGGF